MCRNPCNCTKRHFLRACYAAGGAENAQAVRHTVYPTRSHGPTCDMSDHVKHEPPFTGATVFTMLSQCTARNRKRIGVNMYGHVCKHRHARNISECEKKNLNPLTLSLWNLYQLTDGMLFKLTWSINHVMDHNETPFRLELKDPWCGS